MKCSVIIPTWNSERHIEKCIVALRLFNPDGEIIVSDGGSLDRTLQLLVEKNVNFYASDKGRGIQLNEGSKRAAGEILFFLHADTIITEEVFPAIKRLFQDVKVNVAKCRLKFDQGNVLLNCYAQLARIDSLWTSFGDQGIVVRKKFFEQMGGFPNYPLLEDVAFFQKARKLTRIHTLPALVTTSAERFIRNGIIRQQIFNAKIILKYLFGVAPIQLAKEYEDFRRKK